MRLRKSVTHMVFYKKCKKARTRMEKGIRVVAKASAANDNKHYTDADIYVWKDSAIAFLRYDGGTDVLCMGKRSQELVESSLNEDHIKYTIYEDQDKMVREKDESWPKAPAIMATESYDIPSEYEPVNGKVAIQ